MYMIYAWSKSKSTLVLEFKMKTILLTGGNGFIGRNIRESFLIEKYRILFPPSCELNLSDENSVDDYFKQHAVDIVIHAAVKPCHRNAKDLSNLFYTNTRMFFNLERHNMSMKRCWYWALGLSMMCGIIVLRCVRKNGQFIFPRMSMAIVNMCARK